MLAELARTDMRRLRLLEPDSDETKALRALTRAREDLVEQRVALANQLRAQLDACWPGAAQIFFDVDSPIALAFLERYPSPSDARGLGEKRLTGFLARNRYSGRRSPSELLERIRNAPEPRLGEAELEARRAVVLALVAALKPLVEQIRLLTSQIAGALRAHDDGEIFLSLFRDPKIGHHRRRTPGRDRRQPRPPPHQRLAGSDRRASTRRRPIRQKEGRLLPLGLQQKSPQRRRRPRRQQPQAQPLGRRHLPARPRQRP